MPPSLGRSRPPTLPRPPGPARGWRGLLAGLVLATAAACMHEDGADSAAAPVDPHDVRVRWEATGIRVSWAGPGPYRFGMAEHGNSPGRWTGEDCAAGVTLDGLPRPAACHELEGEVLLRYGAPPTAVRPGQSTAFHPSDAGGPADARTIEEYARGTSYFFAVGDACYRWSAGAQNYQPWDGCTDW